MKIKTIRDLFALIIGGFGLIYSQVTGKVYPELIMTYTVLLGSPLMFHLVERKKKDDDSGSDK